MWILISIWYFLCSILNLVIYEIKYFFNKMLDFFKKK